MSIYNQIFSLNKYGIEEKSNIMSQKPGAKWLKFFMLPLLLTVGVTVSAQTRIGIFEKHADIGPVKHQGSATFNASTNSYTLTGSGENIWFKKDELHFAWVPLRGNFLVSTEPQLIGAGTDPHRKLGWMVRASTDTSAAMVCLTVHGDGLTAFQFRKKAGTNVEEIKIPVHHADVLQLERRGRSFIVSVSKLGLPFWTVEVPDFDFPEEMLVGIFISSHNKEIVEKGIFSNTRVFKALH